MNLCKKHCIYLCLHSGAKHTVNVDVFGRQQTNCIYVFAGGAKTKVFTGCLTHLLPKTHYLPSVDHVASSDMFIQP